MGSPLYLRLGILCSGSQFFIGSCARAFRDLVDETITEIVRKLRDILLISLEITKSVDFVVCDN